jgi:hypothetical protein
MAAEDGDHLLAPPDLLCQELSPEVVIPHDVSINQCLKELG